MGQVEDSIIRTARKFCAPEEKFKAKLWAMTQDNPRADGTILTKRQFLVRAQGWVFTVTIERGDTLNSPSRKAMLARKNGMEGD